MKRNLTKCDWCRKISREEEELSVYTIIEPDERIYHFCSSECLRKFVVDVEQAWGSYDTDEKWTETISA